MLVRLSGMIEKRSSKSRVQALYRARSGTFGNRDDRVDLVGSVNPALQKAFSICRIPSLFNIYGFNEDSFNNITNSALKHNPYFVSL